MTVGVYPVVHLRIRQSTSAITLRRWEEKMILVAERTPTGHGRYSLSQLESFRGKEQAKQRVTYLYARVSTQKQADQGNLERQIDRLTEYAMANGYFLQGVPFSARIYGKRGGRVAKRIETVLKEEGERDENHNSSLPS